MADISKKYLNNPYISLNLQHNQIISHSFLKSDLANKCLQVFFNLFETYESEMSDENLINYNYTIYTGVSGHSYFYIHLYQRILLLSNHYGKKFMESHFKNLLRYKDDKLSDILNSLLTKAKYYANIPNIDYLLTKHVNRPSLINGLAGLLYVRFLVFTHFNQFAKRNDCLIKLIKMHEYIAEKKKDSDQSPNEILYGKAGYLMCLLFIHDYYESEIPKSHAPSSSNHNPKLTIDANVKDSLINAIHKISVIILKEGKRYSRQNDHQCPLMYEWHDKEYIGAAHGVSGILYALTCVIPLNILPEKYILLIKHSISYLSSLQFDSGNFPSSLPVGSDKLVQWCHGAPGVIYTFLKAAEVFPEKEAIFLSVSLKCGECIWEKGLLAKSYGLCHGVSGNAYAFLALYNFTGDSLHLNRALKFGKWFEDYGRHGCRTPDTPYSLFEGLAGPLNFLIDIICPKSAKLPLYQIGI
ncbi:unnamed protein product [Gordionus sp. m RMFG-2023]